MSLRVEEVDTAPNLKAEYERFRLKDIVSEGVLSLPPISPFLFAAAGVESVDYWGASLAARYLSAHSVCLWG